MPYKLIKLGKRPPLLFDLSTPDGENLERNLAAKHPEMVQRLEQRLQAWAAKLQPPGLSADNWGLSRHHESLFAEHHVIAADPTDSNAATARPGSRGWRRSGLDCSQRHTRREKRGPGTDSRRRPAEQRAALRRPLASRSGWPCYRRAAAASEGRRSGTRQRHLAHQGSAFVRINLPHSTGPLVPLGKRSAYCYLRIPESSTCASIHRQPRPASRFNPSNSKAAAVNLPCSVSNRDRLSGPVMHA